MNNQSQRFAAPRGGNKLNTPKPKPFNKNTIDPKGQECGLICERAFAQSCALANLSYAHLIGNKVGYDFIHYIGKDRVTVDVKGKERNVDAKPEYMAHIHDSQRDHKVDYYVFANWNKQTKAIQFMGYILKDSFWFFAEPVKQGESDSDGFVQRADAHVLPYSELVPMSQYVGHMKGDLKPTEGNPWTSPDWPWTWPPNV